MSVSRTIEHGGVVAYKTAYARLPGSDAVVAIFLSQVAYWSARSEDGWCWVTHDAMEEQTALTRRQQDRSTTVLVELKILEKELRGLPAKIHYRVDFDALDSILRTTKVVQNVQPVLCKSANHTIEKITEEITCTQTSAATGAAETVSEAQSTGTITAVTGTALTPPEAQSSEAQTKPLRKKRSPTPQHIPRTPPPSQEELSEYMKSTWSWIPALEYEKCHAYHESRGWLDNRGKPWKDWRAVAKTWVTNWKSFNQEKYMEIIRAEQTKARNAAASQTRALPLPDVF